jgi:hypothetical protein
MRLLSGILFIVILVSCHKSRQHNEILKVALSRGGGLMDRGASIYIDTSLIYRYKAGKNYYTGKVSPEFWDTLNKKFEQIHYKSLPKSDEMNEADATYFELTVYWKGGKGRIIKLGSLNNPDDTLLNTIFWLNNSYQHIKLRKTANSMQFETTIQEPPAPPIGRVKFPPPEH